MKHTRTIVVGAGIIGIATAYELIRRGHDVLVLESRDGIALETSFANGSLLTPSMSDPWSAPGAFSHLLMSLFCSHAALKLRSRAIPSLLGWGLKFLRSTAPAQFNLAARSNFLLADYSVRRTVWLEKELGIRYAASHRGIVKVFRDAAAMVQPLRIAEQLAPLGLRSQVLDASGAIAMEPQLRQIQGSIAGAIYYPEDRGGDAYLFCKALAEEFVRLGGQIRTATQVHRILSDAGRVLGVANSAGTIDASTVIVAAGNQTAELLQPLSVRLPIRPAKGYTLTLPLDGVSARPSMPIVDDGLHAGVIPLGDTLRLAGTVEFAGNDLRMSQDRIDNLYAVLKAIFPETARELDGVAGQPWTGLRPMSADGRPFIGPTSIAGLYVNAGHGHLGWTMAAGSAMSLVDHIEGRQESIPMAAFLPERRSGARIGASP